MLSTGVATLKLDDYLTDEKRLYQVVGEDPWVWFVEDCSYPCLEIAHQVRISKAAWSTQKLWRVVLPLEDGAALV